jgi:metallophosphoesterase (TIGR03767 family)
VGSCKRGLTAAVTTAAVLVCLLPAVAQAAPTTTIQQTIQDLDGDNLLEYAPGEDYEVKGAAEDFRPPRQGSILNFLQLSDFQIVDEESPARVEFLDTTQRGPFGPFSAAYRPQESLTTQVAEAMVRQARNTTSPVTGEQLDLTILTGDNADSQQYNETRWFIDILDGGRHVDPNSGVPIPGCEATPGSVYDGVRGGGQGIGYYEPDASAAHEDGDGYSPDRNENQAETGRDVTVRDFPTLFERANERFQTIGLDMPWYSAFGNHDALVQGNSPDAYAGPFGASGETSNPVYQEIATGCAKPSRLPPAYGGDTEQFLRDLASDPSTLADTEPFTVPPDPRRCFLAKDEDPPLAGGAPPPCDSGGWIQQHFLTTGTPLGHGFAERPPAAIANHDGYYAFSPVPGLRFAVLDTVTDECGSVFCSEGSVDDAQFQWLREEIETAASAGQYVLVFSHHTLRTTRFPSTDGSEEPLHFGQRFDRRGNQPQNPTGGMTLEELFCAHPNVIAHVAGHEHENYVEHHECAADQPPTPGPGDFWHISTAAHIDWPQQSRMIELVNNGNGTMSLVLTMLDHDGPANPGGAPQTTDGQGQAADDVLRLAAIGREIAYNDYQGSRGARGAPEDRNVIIVLDRPPPPAS